MKMKKRFYLSVTLAVAAFLNASSAQLQAQQAANPAINVGANDLGGVVASASGPEAGVWVIAETTELGTKMAKMVVTDDQGRYVLPDLPKANYDVWVRGYGLVDSPKVQTTPGKTLDLTAVTAPNAADAAQYYPAIYWYSMLKIPDKSQFPGTGPKGNGISPTMKTQGEYLEMIKTDGCVTCHQIGNEATRVIEPDLGHFNSSYEAWTRRVQSGQAATSMIRNFDRMGTTTALKIFADWTDRIAAGELPASKPQRPQGVERNIVATVWDWSSPTAYLHDEISTDKRNPTVKLNGNGPTSLSRERRRRCSECSPSLHFGWRIPKSPSAFARDPPPGITNANLHSVMPSPPSAGCSGARRVFQCLGIPRTMWKFQPPSWKDHRRAMLRGVKSPKSSLVKATQRVPAALVRLSP